VAVRPLTDRALFHAHTTHLATGALLLPGHACLEQPPSTLARRRHYSQQFQARTYEDVLVFMLLLERNATSCLTAL